jgi:hypothetical protein
MSRVSPTLEGFRAVLRRPSLTFAEIAWRWTAGALAWALSLFWFIEYLDTLPVSNTDATLVSTKQPLLVGRAIAHILRGSLNRAALAVMLAVIALSLLWIVAASIGRAATVRALFDYFHSGVASNASTTYDATKPLPLRSLIGLNFLRVAVVLASFLASVGAAILASFASPDRNPQPGLAFVLFLPLAGLICVVCWALNWLLSMAGIFAVRDDEDVLSALSAAVTFSRERSGPVFAVSTWTGLAHLVAFSVAMSTVSLPLAFIQIAPTRLIIATVILGTLAYFAVVDWLYMARLAGYVSIAEMPEAWASSASPSAPPPTSDQFAPSLARTTIDRDESILSDIPIPALESSET